MIKRRKNKSLGIILGSFLILFGVLLPLSKVLYEHHLNKNETESIESFFDDSDNEITNETVEEDIPPKEEDKPPYNYIAVLEIPSISLKRGLVSKTDKANNINQNVQILKESDMPNVMNGNFILAGHSGTGRVAFYRNLDRVKNGDSIYVYYNNIKYTYKVVDLYTEVKDGDINIHRDNKKTTLTLTTCTPNKKDSQFVVISELVSQENY